MGAHILTVEVEYIYFLIGLARHGFPISLKGSRGGDITTQEIIVHHCFPTKMSGKNIPIKEVMDFTLHTVLFTMHRVAGNQGAHQASRVHMLYALEAMEPTFFNWAEALLNVFKDQLTKCWQGELK